MEMADTTSATTTGTISQGLLVREMATGNVQLGYDDFVQGDPAPLPIFSGVSTADDVLTYADFALVVSTPAGNRTGEVLDEWIVPGGSVTEDTPPVELLAGRFEPITGYNIPRVTASWLETKPFGVQSSDALGLPISEPYWVHSGKGEAGISLIQLFERRVVVYTPDLPLAERFSLTSAGRHYYRWRYGNDPGPDGASSAQQLNVVPPADRSAGLALPDGYQATILTSVVDAFDIAVTPEGRLAVGYSDGRIELIDPDNPATERTVYTEHLANPSSFAWAGTDLYVVDDRGLYRYHDVDANGIADASQAVIEGGFERATVQLASGPEAALYLTGRSLPSAKTATPEPSSGYGLYRVEPNAIDDDDVDPASLNADLVTSIVVDDTGVIWLIDDAGQLVQYVTEAATQRPLLDASRFSSIRDLVLYRPDGTSGDPFRDMLALADGRIVRFQPSRPSDQAGTPTASTPTGPAAIVDFITGFDRPIAMTSGLDGSLYVLDSGRGVVYRIRPV